LDLNELAAEIHKTALDHGWWSKPVKEWNFAEDLMLIVSEASEALEDWRKGYEVSVPGYEYVQSTEPLEYKPVGIPSELADILIRVLDVSVAYGVDIQAAVSEKIAYNKTRSYRHGGKRT
jgi:NTP pyrophosphatase (non-canonical NTP hydrolase)